MFKAITIILAAIAVTGCAGMQSAASGCKRDYRDRSYDPCGGRALFEQIPNWDSRLDIHAAQRGPAARDIVIIDKK